MIEKFLNFTDPLNRKDYIVQTLKRLFLYLVIISLFNFLNIVWEPSLKISNDFWGALWEDRNGVGSFLEAAFFLPLDIRRIKDINLSINWIYIYYACLFLPFPKESFESGNPIAITFESFAMIFVTSFFIFLLIKKSSNRK